MQEKNLLLIKKKLEIAQRNNMPNKDLMVGSLEYLIGLQYSYLNDKKNMNLEIFVLKGEKYETLYFGTAMDAFYNSSINSSSNFSI